MKRGGFMKWWDKRYFIACVDAIYYYETKEMAYSYATPRGMISLVAARVEALADPPFITSQASGALKQLGVYVPEGTATGALKAGTLLTQTGGIPLGKETPPSFQMSFSMPPEVVMEGDEQDDSYHPFGINIQRQATTERSDVGSEAEDSKLRTSGQYRTSGSIQDGNGDDTTPKTGNSQGNESSSQGSSEYLSFNPVIASLMPVRGPSYSVSVSGSVSTSYSKNTSRKRGKRGRGTASVSRNGSLHHHPRNLPDSRGLLLTPGGSSPNHRPQPPGPASPFVLPSHRSLSSSGRPGLMRSRTVSERIETAMTVTLSRSKSLVPGELPFCLAVHSANNRTFYLQASSSEERDEWVMFIQEQVRDPRLINT